MEEAQRDEERELELLKLVLKLKLQLKLTCVVQEAAKRQSQSLRK
jgi:hypothetical protein